MKDRGSRPRPVAKIMDYYESDCCHAIMDDWWQEIKRCPICKESCEALYIVEDGNV